MKRYITVGAGSLFALIILLMTVTIVPEGYVGVVKTWGKADKQINPGLNFKVPVMNTVELVEVRQRKNTEQLSAATNNQLPVTATTSINWTVNKTAVMELFIKYGGLEQFERRILDPKLRSASKAAIAKFPADVLIRDRQAAVNEIMIHMTDKLEGFPITIDSPQLENIEFAPTYLDAVTEKERARENAEREKHNLERQRLEALQAVNSAEANAEAKRIEADAEAYRVLTVAEAEAQAVKKISQSLSESSEYVQYLQVTRWDGTLSRTMLSDEGAMVLVSPDRN